MRTKTKTNKPTHSIHDYALAIDKLSHDLGAARTMVHLLTSDLQQRDQRIAELTGVNATQYETITRYHTDHARLCKIIEAWKNLHVAYES
jgi:hypothetical protein